MARSGVASAPPQTGTLLRRPKRPRKVQDCSSALRPVRTCPIRLLILTRTPHGGPLSCPAMTAPGTGNCLSPVNVATTLRALTPNTGKNELRCRMPIINLSASFDRPQKGHRHQPPGAVIAQCDRALGWRARGSGGGTPKKSPSESLTDFSFSRVTGTKSIVRALPWAAARSGRAPMRFLTPQPLSCAVHYPQAFCRKICADTPCRMLLPTPC